MRQLAIAAPWQLRLGGAWPCSTSITINCASTLLRFPLSEDGVANVRDRKRFGDFQADSVKAVIYLASLKPDCPANFIHPLSARLVGRFMDMAAATEQRLVLADKL